MTTLFVVCFIAGLGLSVVSFVSGLQHVTCSTTSFTGIACCICRNAIRHAGLKTSEAVDDQRRGDHRVPDLVRRRRTAAGAAHAVLAAARSSAARSVIG